MKIEIDDDTFKTNIISSLFKNKMIKKKYNNNQKRNISDYTTKFSIYSPKKTKGKIRFSKFRIKDTEENESNKVYKKNNMLSRNIFSEYIKKKKLLINKKSGSSSYFINLKLKKGLNKSLLKPIAIPFRDIKFLNFPLDLSLSFIFEFCLSLYLLYPLNSFAFSESSLFLINKDSLRQNFLLRQFLLVNNEKSLILL